MLWLALHLPRLSLEAFGTILSPEQQARPVALLHAHRIHSVNRAAAEAGVRPGMKRATALALVQELLLAEASPQRDAAALAAVVHVALGFTPAVCTEGPQTVLLELHASLRLFGGLAALRQRVQQALKPLHHHVQMAAAPTALGAALLAQWYPRQLEQDLVCGPHAYAYAHAQGQGGDGARSLAALHTLLDQAPVWLLGPGKEHWDALQGMGLHTLSDLRRLPRSGLARRFGAVLLTELDRAFGAAPDPREWLELPAVFDSRLELHSRAEDSAQVLHGAAVLLARLVAWAQARGARIGGFVLRMLHERQRQVLAPPTELAVALAEPSLAPEHLHVLLRERLAHVALAAPTLELHLHCRQLVQGQAPNGELFPSAASQAEGLMRLLERLGARLGPEQVQRVLPVADHRPERASRRVPAQDSAAWADADTAAAVQAAAAQAKTDLPRHRPTWLLPEPQPLGERDALPLFKGRPLAILSGPERIETGWWDDAPTARDYYIAQADDGSLLWLYRSRLPVAAGDVAWYLHGRYG